MLLRYVLTSNNSSQSLQEYLESRMLYGSITIRIYSTLYDDKGSIILARPLNCRSLEIILWERLIVHELVCIKTRVGLGTLLGHPYMLGIG